jgi:hypothetical protein
MWQKNEEEKEQKLKHLWTQNFENKVGSKKLPTYSRKITIFTIQKAKHKSAGFVFP